MITKITNIGSLVTWSEDENKIVTLSDVDILIEDGLITKIRMDIDGGEEEIDADGALITPGFVDPHTHPVFYGNRSHEFAMRVEGRSYEEIAAAGGGIISSIKGVRETPEDELYEESIEHVDFFIFNGTTTIEAKSGYGLDTESELKSLRVIRKIQETALVDIFPTFLGAHAFPPEYRNDHDGYVRLICDEMIPRVAEEKLAVFCDVFCEKGYFSVDQSRRILTTAKDYGLIPRLHADEFQDSGAAELAAEVQAVSADHLMAVSRRGIQAMAKAGVIATVLPGTTLFLGKNEYVNARRLLDEGCEVALATDFNPGSCTIQSMSLILSLAVLYCGMTPSEALKASTYTAAKSLGIHHKMGCIQEGYHADLLFWEADSINEIPYWVGNDRILTVMKRGRLIDEVPAG